MFQYHVEAPTFKELTSKLRDDLLSLGYTFVTTIPIPGLEPPAKKTKTKLEMSSDPIPTASVPEPPPAPLPEVSFDQMKEALQKVANTGLPGDENGANLKRATKILNDHEYRKIKDVKPEDYKKIFDACSVALQTPAPLAGGIF